MAQVKVTNGYDKLSDSALLEKAIYIYQQVSSRPTVFATPLPSMTVLKDTCNDYSDALALAQSGDIVAISAKNVLKDDLIGKLHQLSNYVQLTANGNPHIITEAGMNDTKERSPRILGDAIIVSADYTGTSGEVELKAKCTNGRSFILQYTSDPELRESSWKSMPPISRSKGKITGLTPGATYFFRVCVTGSSSQIAYSSVISKMAV